jgi:hypothetical protein
VVTTANGPSEAAVRVATLLARSDGGHSDVLVTSVGEERLPAGLELRALEKRISRHGFDGHLRTGVTTVADAVSHSVLTGEPSLVLVDDPTFACAPGPVPVLVLKGTTPDPDSVRLIPAAGPGDGVGEEIRQRLERGSPKAIPGLGKRAETSA